MKKLYTILGLITGILLVVPFIAGAINITVPSAPSNGYTLVSTTTGAYNATTTIFINSASNVGIGTTVPGVTLDVQAATAIQRIMSTTGTNYAYSDFNNTSGNLYVGIDNSTGSGFGGSAYARIIYGDGAYPMSFATNGSTKMTILSAGNVGIGTTNPTKRLQVVDANGALLRLSYDAINTADWDFTRSVATGALSIQGTQINFNNILLAPTSGNVGIGTTSPDTLLSVNGTTKLGNGAWPTIQLGNSGQRVGMFSDTENGYLLLGNMQSGQAADRGGQLFLGARRTSGSVDFGYAGILGAKENSVNTDGSSYLAFQTAGVGGNATEVARFKSNGNFGINTTNPLAPLEIKGASPYLYLNSTNGSAADSEFQIQRSGVSKWAFGTQVGDGSENLNFYNYTNSRVNLTLQQSNGNVGINQPTPLAKLHVYGDGSTIDGTGDTPKELLIEGNNYAYGSSFTNDSIVSNATIAADIGGSIGLGSKYSSNAYALFGEIKAGKNNSSGGDYGGYLTFGTRTNGSPIAERVRIDTTGQVGIGTTSPAANLDVNPSSGASSIQAKGTTASILINHTIVNGASSINYRENGVDKFIQGIGVYRTDTKFDIGNAASSFLTIDTSGNLGIGTTSPFAQLSVAASSNVVFAVSTSTGTSGMPNFEIDANGHPVYSGPKPKCDASCTFTAGNDARFRITTGSSITTTTVTFANSWGTLAPLCHSEEGSAGTIVANASSTPTTVTINIASALTSKDIEIWCDGIQ